jgi:2-iminoacetate synthase ThiH
MYVESNADYQVLFQENHISLLAFEKSLQKTIASIDAKEIDFLETKFDMPYTSAFSYLQKTTMQEIAELSALPLSERKNLLQAENIKYEAYLTWMDAYEHMTQIITPLPTMKFEELFTKWMVETEMTDY